MIDNGMRKPEARWRRGGVAEIFSRKLSVTESRWRYLDRSYVERYMDDTSHHPRGGFSVFIINHMNPAEEIVKYWLQSKGYFLQSSIRLPQNRELDILAINDKGDRLHIEVSAAVRMANYSRNAEELEDFFNTTKFLSIAHEAESRLGKEYKKYLVVGKVLFGNKDIKNEFVDECKKLNINVWDFGEIVTEVSNSLSTHSHLNPIIKAIQLANVFSK